MNSCVSSCSVWDRECIFPGMVAGAPGFSSIAWSQIRTGGKLWDSSSLKTFMNCVYCGGTPGADWLDAVPMVTLPIYICWVLLVRGMFLVRGVNCALAASGDRSMMGSCEWSNHPRRQSIFGCTAANQGYPRMALLSPKSDKKNRKLVLWVPVRTSRSV